MLYALNRSVKSGTEASTTGFLFDTVAYPQGLALAELILGYTQTRKENHLCVTSTTH